LTHINQLIKPAISQAKPHAAELEQPEMVGGVIDQVIVEE
jgi:hypothetical protein